EFRAENQIPVDQHMLASLCVDPNRYLFIICSCQNENWVNAPAQWMTYLGAKHVFDYVGLGDHLAINVHLSGHAVIAEDMEYMMSYFDKHVYGIEPKKDLSNLTHSPFELSQNKDPFADTFAKNWLY
ncbi:MAG: acetylxylan esterase, partial [Oscillospiraceae bacterium]|nr:acetylxylan esterase [Oscillospiraceae bacterium]